MTKPSAAISLLFALVSATTIGCAHPSSAPPAPNATAPATALRSPLDPGPFAQAGHLSQRMPRKLEPWEINWASAYVARFPEPVLTSLLQQAGPDAANIWTGDQWGDI